MATYCPKCKLRNCECWWWKLCKCTEAELLEYYETNWMDYMLMERRIDSFDNWITNYDDLDFADYEPLTRDERIKRFYVETWKQYINVEDMKFLQIN